MRPQVRIAHLFFTKLLSVAHYIEKFSIASLFLRFKEPDLKMTMMILNDDDDDGHVMTIVIEVMMRYGVGGTN